MDYTLRFIGRVVESWRQPWRLEEMNSRHASSSSEVVQSVLDHPNLSTSEKIGLLYEWAYDAAEMAVAEEEGMPGGGEDALRPVLLALHELTGGMDAERAAPTKQHGLALPGDHRSGRLDHGRSRSGPARM